MNHTLTSPCGITVTVSDRGAGVQSVSVPDRSRCFSNIALNTCAIDENPSQTAYAGVTLGPAAGRVPDGWLLLNGQKCTLTSNEGKNHLHGGAASLSGRRWRCVSADASTARFVCEVEAGIDGYPGNRRFTTDYLLNADGRLTIRLRCETDAPTWVNLSNHLYWNLSGNFDTTVDDHTLYVNAARVMWNDGEHIPQTCRNVSGTALDFRQFRLLGERLAQPEVQLINEKGLNHLYLPDQPNESVPVACLHHPASARSVSLYTDLPAVMIYTGGYLNESIALEGGRTAHPRCALAMEPQLLPITPTMREASVITSPEQPFDYWISYVFSVDV